MCDILPYMRAQRQTGRTTALACAALMIGGIFVVASEANIATIHRQFPTLDVRSVSMHTLIGNSKPMILDHLVTELMIAEARGGCQAINAKKYLKIARIVNDGE